MFFIIFLHSILSGLNESFLSEVLLSYLFLLASLILLALKSIGYGNFLLLFALIVSKSNKCEFFPKEQAAVINDEDIGVFEFL